MAAAAVAAVAPPRRRRRRLVLHRRRRRRVLPTGSRRQRGWSRCAAGGWRRHYPATVVAGVRRRGRYGKGRETRATTAPRAPPLCYKHIPGPTLGHRRSPALDPPPPPHCPAPSPSRPPPHRRLEAAAPPVPGVANQPRATQRTAARRGLPLGRQPRRRQRAADMAAVEQRLRQRDGDRGVAGQAGGRLTTGHPMRSRRTPHSS